MCLIIAKRKGTEFSDFMIDAMIQASRNNRDGHGFVLKQKNRVVLVKGLMPIENLIERLVRYDIENDDELVFHARINTKGRTADYNCHPFVLTPTEIDRTDVVYDMSQAKMMLFYAHNGGMIKYENDEHDKSDTYLVGKQLFCLSGTRLLFKQDKNAFEKYIVEPVINYSRLAFVSGDPDIEMRLYGNAWHQDGNLYFSHQGHLGYNDWSRKLNNYNDSNKLILLNQPSKKARYELYDWLCPIQTIDVLSKVGNVYYEIDENDVLEVTDVRFNSQTNEYRYDLKLMGRGIETTLSETTLNEQFIPQYENQTKDTPAFIDEMDMKELEEFEKEIHDLYVGSVYIPDIESEELIENKGFIICHTINDETETPIEQLCYIEQDRNPFFTITEFNFEDKTIICDVQFGDSNEIEARVSFYADYFNAVLRVYVDVTSTDDDQQFQSRNTEVDNDDDDEDDAAYEVTLHSTNVVKQNPDEWINNPFQVIFGGNNISRNKYKSLLKALRFNRPVKVSGKTVKASKEELIDFLEGTVFSQEDPEFKAILSKK